MMGFAICPDDGPPRLWRYVDDPDMTAAGMVTSLDQKQNILVINRPLFDSLGELEKVQVLRTRARHEFV